MIYFQIISTKILIIFIIIWYSHYIDPKVAPFFKKRYEGLMEGCYKEYSKRECDATERARLEMSLAQPKEQHNYTEVGFKKIKTPKGIKW